jgi:hypothetical protein
MPREIDFNREIIYDLNQIRYEWRMNALVLGGSSGSGGGSGTSPGGVFGLLPQKHVAGDTTESFLFSSGSPSNLVYNLNNIRGWLLPSHNFWADTSNSNYLIISSGSWYYEDGKPPMSFAGGNTPSLTAPVSGSRYDLLTINDAGALAWSSTTSYPTTLPSAIAKQLPLWMVLSRSSGSAISRYDDGTNHYIYEDMRPYLGAPTYMPSTGSAYIDYQWYTSGSLSGAADMEGVYYISDTFTLRGSHGYVDTTPSSGSAIIDIEYSIDNGVSWTSIYSGAKLIILAGDNYGVQTPDALNLAAGTLMRAAIDDPGSGASTLSVNLYGTIRSASGGGTVTTVSAAGTQGVTTSVANPTTTPSITIGLGDIAPTSVTSSGSLSGINLSGINTGDQTITLAGSVVGAGTGVITTALSDTGVVPGPYFSANITVGTDGRITSATTGSGSPISPSLPEDVADTPAQGASDYASAGDHVHRGVTSVTKDSAAYGAITLAEGSNITIAQAGSTFTIASTAAGGASFGYCGGRLSLVNNNPVGETASSSTLYYAPYITNAIELYDGANWNYITFTQASIDLSSGYLADTNYDLFGYNNSGALALETLAWATDNNRDTNVVYIDGRLCKEYDATRRYLGTFRMKDGTSSQDDRDARFVWNYFNRINRTVSVSDSSSHTYNSPVWQDWNGSPLGIRFLRGYAEEVDFPLTLAVDFSTDAEADVAVTASAGTDHNICPVYTLSSVQSRVTATEYHHNDTDISADPQGYYYFQIQEKINGGTTSDYYAVSLSGFIRA